MFVPEHSLACLVFKTSYAVKSFSFHNNKPHMGSQPALPFPPSPPPQKNLSGKVWKDSVKLDVLCYASVRHHFHTIEAG